jgi:hypothetical protein
MLLGSFAFLIYAVLTRFVLLRFRASAFTASFALLPIWFAVSLGSWMLLRGRW